MDRREFVKGAAVAAGSALLPQVSDGQESSSGAQPNEWYYQGLWREVPSDLQGKGYVVRIMLVALLVYPPKSLDDSAFDVQDANYRAAFHEIVDQLNREDLSALFEAARMLWAERDSTFCDTAREVYEESLKRFLGGAKL